MIGSSKHHKCQFSLQRRRLKEWMHDFLDISHKLKSTKYGCEVLRNHSKWGPNSFRLYKCRYLKELTQMGQIEWKQLNPHWSLYNSRLAWESAQGPKTQRLIKRGSFAFQKAIRFKGIFYKSVIPVKTFGPPPPRWITSFAAFSAAWNNVATFLMRE